MNLRLTTVALAVFAVHAAVGNIYGSGCMIPHFIITKFSEDECTGECQTYARTQPKVDAIADSFGWSVAYDTTDNSLVGSGQLAVGDFVTNCTAAGFPLSKVTVVEPQPDTEGKPVPKPDDPSQSQSNPAATPSDKNVGVSSNMMSMVFANALMNRIDVLAAFPKPFQTCHHHRRDKVQRRWEMGREWSGQYAKELCFDGVNEVPWENLRRAQASLNDSSILGLAVILRN
ncbi:hypothetical protein C8J56DRAFT_1056940 [Mycena floridula]|nr:hypothetical protein C8J56DRAFT_1056940 [Mycena floridula]